MLKRIFNKRLQQDSDRFSTKALDKICSFMHLYPFIDKKKLSIKKFVIKKECSRGYPVNDSDI